MARIDDAVRRILRGEGRVGALRPPPAGAPPLVEPPQLRLPEHRAVAREAVRKSLVLLKNEWGALPLSPGGADPGGGEERRTTGGHQCGGFTVKWQGSSGNELIEGGDLQSGRGSGSWPPPPWLSPDGSAADGEPFDVAIVVIGERPYAEGFGDIRPGGTVQLGSALPNPAPQVDLPPYAPTLGATG